LANIIGNKVLITSAIPFVRVVEVKSAIAPEIIQRCLLFPASAKAIATKALKKIAQKNISLDACMEWLINAQENVRASTAPIASNLPNFNLKKWDVATIIINADHKERINPDISHSPIIE